MISFPKSGDAFAQNWFIARMTNKLELAIIVLLTVNLATVFVNLISDCKRLRAFLYRLMFDRVSVNVPRTLDIWDASSCPSQWDIRPWLDYCSQRRNRQIRRDNLLHNTAGRDIRGTRPFLRYERFSRTENKRNDRRGSFFRVQWYISMKIRLGSSVENARRWSAGCRRRSAD